MPSRTRSKPIISAEEKARSGKKDPNNWAAPERNGVALKAVKQTANGNIWHWWAGGRIERNGAVYKQAYSGYSPQTFYNLIIEAEGPDALPRYIPRLTKEEKKAGIKQDSVTKQYRIHFNQIDGKVLQKTR